MRSPAILRLSLAVLFVVAGACSSGDGPTTTVTLAPAIEARSREPVTGTASPARPARVWYRAVPDEQFVVRFQGLADSLALVRVRGADTLVLVAAAMHVTDTTGIAVGITASPTSDSVAFAVVARGRRGGAFRLVVDGQGRNPETTGAVLAPDQVAQDRIDSPTDVDVWQLPNVSSAPIIVLARLLDEPAIGAPPVRLSLRPLPDVDRFPPLVARTLTTAPSLDASGDGRIVVTPGDYQLVVERPSTGSTFDDKVRYQLLVRRVNILPEDGDGTLRLNDTTASTLDVPGDIDDYRVSGTPGGTVYVSIQTLDSAAARIQALEGTPSGVLDAARGAPLLGGTTIVRTFDANGQVRVRIDGTWPTRGGYRLFPYLPDPAPEERAAGFAPGELVTSRIDAPGDRDEFTTSFAAGDTVFFRLDRPTGVAPLTLGLVTQNGGQTPLLQFPAGETPGVTTLVTGLFAAGAGTMRTYVQGGVPVPGTPYPASYRFAVTRVSAGPETRSAAIAIGDVVTGEAIDAPGDIDTYTVSSTGADSVVLKITSATRGTSIPFRAFLSEPSGTFARGTTVPAGRDSAQRGLVMDRAGTWRLGVSTDGPYAGGYVLSLTRRGAVVEHGTSTLVVGDSVVGERIDYSGDVDGFVMDAAPGATVTLRGRGARDADVGNGFFAAIYDAATARLIDSFVFMDGNARDIVMPAGGRVRIAVFESDCSAFSCSGAGALTGPYVLGATLK